MKPACDRAAGPLATPAGSFTSIALGGLRCYNRHRMPIAEETSRVEIDRILQSDTFRSSDVLRRLLRFLAEKAIAGEADQLKEYAIGLDAFGKPPTYDPRSDAIVRLQAGRLRQKLAEYYRTEGKDDAVVVDLPRGHFKLVWRPQAVMLDPPAAAPAEPARAVSRPSRMAVVLGALLLASLAWNVRDAILRWNSGTASAAITWTPELRTLWEPFIENSRPLLVAFEDSLFVGVIGADGNVAAQLRVTGKNRWEDLINLPAVSALRKGMGNLELAPRYNFAARSDLDAAMRLGKLLGPWKPALSTARLSQITWQSLSDNNVLMIGSKQALAEKLLGLLMKPELVVEDGGVRNLHPQPGEPAMWKDTQPATFDGEVFALVSAMPGPVGNTRVGGFSSNRFWGNAGAIESFTSPVFARMIVGKLKADLKKVPQYYQVLLKIKYRDGVATDVSYVTGREVSAMSPAARKED